MKSLTLLFLTTSLILSIPSLAQISEFKLLPSDGAPREYFGKSVSISGDYAIAGAYGDDDNGYGSGSAYIFKREGSIWTEEQKLLASDGAENDNFGQPVSISGDYAIVGAVSDDDNGDRSGSAYIFKREGSIWTEEQKLIASDGAPLDFFGGSVVISGEYIIVGASGDDDNGDSKGSAYIFKREGSIWTEEQKLIASEGNPGNRFGVSVVISGDYAIVGAYGDTDYGLWSGAAYIYSNFVVGIENEKLEHPLSFSLHQNYPNPFNPSTTISYSVPEIEFVTLKVYDVLGNEVATLVNEEKSVGSYEIEFNGTGLPSGIYFYRIQSGSFVETKKMILIK